jgi:multimeric flavodoxin WrbA
VTTLFSIIANLMHFGMVIVGLDYAMPGRTLDEITGDSPYGATTIAGGDGSAETRSLWTKRRHIAAFRARPASAHTLCWHAAPS